MTSLEAAALILSEGKTTDVEQAELMASGKLMDPDALERAYYRRLFGFDVTVLVDEAKHQAIVRDDELGLTVKFSWLEDDTNDGNAKRLSKACIKLMKKHEDYLNTQEAETNE
jgi:hypothetical protein